MRLIKLFTIILILGNKNVLAQNTRNEDQARFYLGASFGTSFALGDFKDQDRTNESAGFAENGTKFDLYSGFYLTEKITFIGSFRYQTFETNVEDLVNEFRIQNPDTEYKGSTGNWRTYYLLGGITYRLKIGKKFSIFPRVGLGPMLVSSPSLSAKAQDATSQRNFSRSSETGIGVGYEIGIGFRNELGRRLLLLPTFAFSGGRSSIANVETITDNVLIVSKYEPLIQSFNLGISLAYRFY